METRQPSRHYRSRARQPADPRAKVPDEPQYAPRRAKRSRPGARHARRSPGPFVELAQAASRWLGRVGTRGGRRAKPRVIWLKRVRPFLASARRYSSHLSAVAGVIIVLFSVYLIRQGVMLPTSVPLGGGTPPGASGEGVPAAKPSGTGVEGQLAAGSGQESATGAAGQASGGEAAQPVTGAGAGAGAGATGGAAAAEEPSAQPVMEDEGTGAPSAADVGPRSVGEILSLFEAPASGKVVRGFGWYESAVFQDWRYHTGVDIALQAGDPVRAAGDGLVTSVEGTRFEGWRIVVSHGPGVTTIYSQLGSTAVAEGDSVSRGQSVGLAGASGTLEADLGVHLHYEIRLDNSETDPTPYLGG